jgi:hypothetical protein
MSENNGGQAFPSSGIICDDGILYEGMTLRDYFAAKAMQGIIVAVGEVLPKDPHQQVALDAYKFADAMLAERKKE